MRIVFRVGKVIINVARDKTAREVALKLQRAKITEVSIERDGRGYTISGTYTTNYANVALADTAISKALEKERK